MQVHRFLISKKEKKKEVHRFLLCEYIVEPTHACSKERKLWKKKKIDVLTHCKKKEKKKKKKRNKDSLHDLPYETKKQDSCV